jgi:hypothetical protein
VRTLEEDHRTVIALRYFHDLKVDEIAAVLDVPAGTVKSRINRALAKLAESLGRAHAGGEAMNCREVDDALERYIAGDLDDREASEVAEHLKGCACVRRRLRGDAAARGRAQGSEKRAPAGPRVSTRSWA